MYVQEMREVWLNHLEKFRSRIRATREACWLRRSPSRRAAAPTPPSRRLAPSGCWRRTRRSRPTPSPSTKINLLTFPLKLRFEIKMRLALRKITHIINLSHEGKISSIVRLVTLVEASEARKICSMKWIKFVPQNVVLAI